MSKGAWVAVFIEFVIRIAVLVWLAVIAYQNEAFFRGVCVIILAAIYWNQKE